MNTNKAIKLSKYRINFNLRRSRTNSEGEAPIYIIIRWDGNTINLPTNESVNPKRWNDERGSKGFQRPKDDEVISTKLDEFESKAKKIFNSFNVNSDKRPTEDEFLQAWHKDKKEAIKFNKLHQSFEDYIQYFDAEYRSRYGLSPNEPLPLTTGINTYTRTYALLKEFDPIGKYDFDDINMKFRTKFVKFLQNHEVRKHNTKKGVEVKYMSTNNIAKIITALITVLKTAFDEGATQNRFFMSKRFKMEKQEVIKPALTEDQVNAIERLDLEGLDAIVRDYFVLSCWTGMRYSDLLPIPLNERGQNWTDERDQGIKDRFIKYVAKKTRKRQIVAVTPILPATRRVLDKYGGKFPDASITFRSRYLNVRVRRIVSMIAPITDYEGNLIDIEKDISFHTGRRTMNTYLKRKGIEATDIMKVMGHVTLEMNIAYDKRSVSESAISIDELINQN